MVSMTVDTSTVRYEFWGWGANYIFGADGADGDTVWSDLTQNWGRLQFMMEQWEGTNDNDDPDVINWAGFSTNPSSNDLAHSMRRQDQFSDAGYGTVLSCWYAPSWMQPNGDGTVIPRENWDEMFESIVAYLLHMKDTYGYEPDYYSFNEPWAGAEVAFDSQDHRDFIEQFGQRLESEPDITKTKLLLGDNASPAGSLEYTDPVYNDSSLWQYVGAVAFHSWTPGWCDPNEVDDTLPDCEWEWWKSDVGGWATRAAEMDKPLLVTEHGWDSADYTDDSWTRALYNMRGYMALFELTTPQIILQWSATTVERMTSDDGTTKYPIFYVCHHFANLTPQNAKVLATTGSTGENFWIAAFKKGSDYVVHLANVGSSSETFDVSGLPDGITTLSAVRTSETENAVSLADVSVTNGSFSLAMDPESLVTLSGTDTTQNLIYAHTAGLTGVGAVLTVSVADVGLINPAADAAAGTWSAEDGATVGLYASVDEDVADDADFIRSNAGPSNSPCVLKLEAIPDPGSDDHHTVRYRYRRTGLTASTLTVELRQGYSSEASPGTLIVSWTESTVGEGWATRLRAISPSAAGNITDYSDLYLRFVADT